MMALFEQIQQLLANANQSTIHYLSHQLSHPSANTLTEDVAFDAPSAPVQMGVPLNL